MVLQYKNIWNKKLRELPQDSWFTFSGNNYVLSMSIIIGFI